MTPWRQKAEQTFPELVPSFVHTDTPYLLWNELRNAFQSAYARIPHDESLISRIYSYSDWCCDQPGGETAADDLATCVAVSFYEHIPLHAIARDDMPRWWLAEDVVGMKGIFGYQMSDEAFGNLTAYIIRERCRYDPTLRIQA